VLIDKPLAAYRIHGGNLFAKHASLHHMCNFPLTMDDGPRASRLALMHVVANAERFAEKGMFLSTFAAGLANLGRKAFQASGRHSLAWRLRTLAVRVVTFYWRIKLRLG
jgi:hypothetical protein